STTVGGAIGLAVRRLGPALLAFLLFLFPVAMLLTPLFMQMMQNPSEPPPAPSLAFMVLSVLAFVVGVRVLAMVIPAAAAVLIFFVLLGGALVYLDIARPMQNPFQ
ncbi:MAG: hypothetical protein KY393_04235, partial [Actinobacteria bacterium]|nr:hypothetical protein [Actinomycetota bacterium]